MKLHNNFQLNGRGFSSPEELINFSKEISKGLQLFLKEWFAKTPSIEVHTSGSTGTPKTILLKKEFLIHSAQATQKELDLGAHSTALMCLSENYIAGKMMLVRALVLGWDLEMVAPDSNPLKDVNKTYDFSAMVPLQLQNSLDKLDQIQKVIVGGGVVSLELKEQLQSVDTIVYATYGMTETSTHIALKQLNHFSEGECSKHSFYKVLPNVKIYKDTRNCLVIDAPKVSDGILFTNDVVQFISDTQFEWLGRYDNVINSGGIKLHPEKIEEKLSGILDQRFFVTGIFDPQLGEKLVLVVEFDGGDVSTFRSLVANKINALQTLSRFEVPKEIYVTSNFVETATKKIQRKKTLDLIDRI